MCLRYSKDLMDSYERLVCSIYVLRSRAITVEYFEVIDFILNLFFRSDLISVFIAILR